MGRRRGWWGWRCSGGLCSLLGFDLLHRFGSAGGVVPRVAQDRHAPGRQVDDTGLTEFIFGITQVDRLRVGQRVWRRGRGGGGWGRRGGGRDCGSGRGRCGGLHPQDVLVAGGIGTVDQLQVAHLLVKHPDPVDLVQLRE